MIRALALTLLLAAPAWAEDCARFEDPLAYNSCLARQGPAAKAVRVGRAPAAARPRANVVSRRGRSEMVFSIGR